MKYDYMVDRSFNFKTHQKVKKTLKSTLKGLLLRESVEEGADFDKAVEELIANKQEKFSQQQNKKKLG